MVTCPKCGDYPSNKYPCQLCDGHGELERRKMVFVFKTLLDNLDPETRKQVAQETDGFEPRAKLFRQTEG